MGGRLKRVTVNLPARTLENATKITGKGITSTIIEGLNEIERRATRRAPRARKGKVRVQRKGQVELERATERYYRAQSAAEKTNDEEWAQIGEETVRKSWDR